MRSDTTKRTGESRFSDTDKIVSLTLLSAVVGAFLAKTLDGAIRRTNLAGEVVWEYSSNVGGSVAGILLLAASFVALNVFVRQIAMTGPPPLERARAWLPIAFLSWATFATLMQRDVAGRDVLSMIAVLILGFACLRQPITLVGASRLGYIYGITLIVNMAVAVAHPRGTSPCRPDKCGLFGNLWTGIFPQENALGIFVVLGAPLVFFISNGFLRFTLLALAAASVLGSGSRTSTLALIVVVLVGLYATRSWPRGIAVYRAPSVLGAALAFAIFIIASDRDLTGRGVILEYVRSALGDPERLTLGGGRQALEEAYRSGLTGGYEFVQEHNQLAHVFNMTGLPGFVLFALMIAVFLRRSWELNTRGAPLLLLAAPALEFATETPWNLDIRSVGLFSFLIFLSTFSQSRTECDHAGNIRHHLQLPTQVSRAPVADMGSAATSQCPDRVGHGH